LSRTYRKGRIYLQTFLFIVTVVLLILTALSLQQLRKNGITAVLGKLAEKDVANSTIQSYYALTGFYLLYVLLLMKQVPHLLVPGIIIGVDNLLFLLFLRRLDRDGALQRYYRKGIGFYLSYAIQIPFFVAALYFLYN
jgi:hypothetical protein